MPGSEYENIIKQAAEQNPTSVPSFYLPEKPQNVGPRAVNTIMFGTSVGIICLNAVWGEPIAIVMCATGLTTMAIKIGKEIVKLLFI